MLTIKSDYGREEMLGIVRLVRFYFFIFKFFLVYLFILGAEREREREHSEEGAARDRGRHTIQNRLQALAVSTEPNTGLELKEPQDHDMNQSQSSTD